MTQNEESDALFAEVEALLQRWLKERRDVLTRYTEIVVALDGQLDEADMQARQKRLCQLLVDYISAGHFEVFSQLVDEAERFEDGRCKLALNILPAIGDTTEVILAYEEKYAGSDSNTATVGDDEKLRRDLSALGELLESRFTLEDQLIAGLHNRHRRQASSPTPS
ncbi:MAG: Rsd/AlgQ family anti-sigma factor [Halioglobus sp.]